jgi:cytochrome c-type biogenesis protein CcmH
LSDTFLVVATLLLLSAGALVVLLPRLWQRVSTPETNADWLRLRQTELIEEAPQLREEAALRLIEEGGVSEPTLAGPRAVYSGPGQLLGVLGLTIGVWLLYWQLGSWEDVQIAEELGRIEQSEPEAVRALIKRITERAEARPTNADYALLLGEYYLSGNEPAEALRYYERLTAAGATAPEILGKAAQAEFLASNRVLSRRARAWAEQALAVDPTQAAALATLGMAAFEAADYRQAIVYWQRLRDLEAPGSPGHEMLGQVIARSRLELGESDEPVVAAPGVVVKVSVPERQSPPEGSVIFILARPEGASAGMPIAVVRTTAVEWPLTVRLDDGSSMAGQRLSDFARVSIEVQISQNGQPGRDNALLWSALESVPVGGDKPVVVQLAVD